MVTARKRIGFKKLETLKTQILALPGKVAILGTVNLRILVYLVIFDSG